MRERLAIIQDRIVRAAQSAGRDPASVTLVAVSKTHPVETLREAYGLGLRCFGENRVQEAEAKIAQLPADIEWHLIGKLQSNKARRAAGLFQVVQTLESLSQLKELAKQDRVIDGLIEVNIGNEPQKGGIFVENLDAFVENVLYCTQVRLRGLMAIGPALEDPEAMRPYFRQMRLLNERFGGEWLSMGMSHDFEVAIQEGATHVRIGTALFGSRS